MYKCYFYVGFCVFIYRAVFQNEKREDFFFNLPMSVAKRRCKTKCFCRLITHASVGPRLFFFFLNWKACLLPGEFTLRNKLAASLQRQIASLAFWCMFILSVAKPDFFFSDIISFVQQSQWFLPGIALGVNKKIWPRKSGRVKGLRLLFQMGWPGLLSWDMERYVYVKGKSAHAEEMAVQRFRGEIMHDFFWEIARRVCLECITREEKGKRWETSMDLTQGKSWVI